MEWQGITGWASSCCIVYTDQSSSNLVARTILDLTLRSAPDPHSEKVLDKIPKDAVVELSGHGDFPSGCRKGPSSATGNVGTWCPVTYGSYTGWANAFYLAARGRPTTDLNLRKAPDLRSDIVLEIPKGGIVDIDHLSDCRTAEAAGSMVPWCPVRYAGQRGWLNPMFLSFEGRVFISPSAAR